MRALGLLFLLCCCACSRDRLYVINEFVNEQSLASYHVGTPDPDLDDPRLGQRLFIHWHLRSKEFAQLTSPELVLDLRYKHGIEETKRHQILRPSGIYTYEVMDDDFFDKGEIRTYRCRLMDGQQELELWQHQLWAEWIRVGESL